MPDGWMDGWMTNYMLVFCFSKKDFYINMSVFFEKIYTTLASLNE
jgi:hypothetical protein